MQIICLTDESHEIFISSEKKKIRILSAAVVFGALSKRSFKCKLYAKDLATD